MGAFQSGFNMGRVMYQQALDNREREQQKRDQAEERALRMRSLTLGVESQEEESRRRRELSRMQQGISDFISGTDRPATNAALNADFDQALAASDAAVMAENAARQGAAMPVATPDAVEVTPVRAPGTPAVPVATSAMPNAEREAALAVRNPVDPSSIAYRQGLNRLQAQFAAAKGDMAALNQLDAEGRAVAEDGMIAERLKGYTGAPEQVAGTRVWLNQNSRRLTMGAPDKNGLVRLSVVTPDGEAEFLKLSRQDQATLYAAAGLMERNPVRALQMIAGVNKTLGEAVAAENNLQSVLAGNVNAIADKSSAIDDRAADNARADRADRRAGDAAKRVAENDAEDRKAKKDARAAARALFLESNPNATPAQLAAVEAGVLSAVPTEDKNAPAEVKLARAALTAKVPGVTNMAEALTWARSRATKPAEEVRAEIYAGVLKQPGGTTERAKRAADQAMRDLYPGMQEAPAPAAGKREASGAVGPAPAKPPSEKAAHDQARAAIAKGADKDAVNKRLTKWGYEPLP